MASLMARAHVFALASRRAPSSEQTEGTPTVLLEAQAVGLPIVSTLHGDIPSIVPERNKASALVPEGSSRALAAALGRTLDRSVEWEDLGRAGRVFVEKRHGKERVVERLEQIYDRYLIGG
jgi:colanic acid/amylovoran biosynthesis glycosyltransferase